jgi:hypothetical protein
VPTGSVAEIRRIPGYTGTHFEAWLIRALLVALFALGGSDLARAAAPPAWAAECAKMDDDAARLACYDVRNPPHKTAARSQNTTSQPAVTAAAAPSAASTLPAASAPASTPTPASVPASRPALDPNFGLAEKHVPAKPAESANLVALVDSVSERTGGELLLKLDNGQSWVQTQRKAGTRIKSGERVTIARGAFGGYLLSSDSGATMRVRRLQ